MADTQVLGTCVFGRAGSSPASRTRYLSIYKDLEDLEDLERVNDLLKLPCM